MSAGDRFKTLKEKLSENRDIKNPAALAAFIGRKKYGKKGMAALSHHKNPYQDAVMKAK